MPQSPISEKDKCYKKYYILPQRYKFRRPPWQQDESSINVPTIVSPNYFPLPARDRCGFEAAPIVPQNVKSKQNPLAKIQNG